MNNLFPFEFFQWIAHCLRQWRFLPSDSLAVMAQSHCCFCNVSWIECLHVQEACFYQRRRPRSKRRRSRRRSPPRARGSPPPKRARARFLFNQALKFRVFSGNVWRWCGGSFAWGLICSSGIFSSGPKESIAIAILLFKKTVKSACLPRTPRPVGSARSRTSWRKSDTLSVYFVSRWTSSAPVADFCVLRLLCFAGFFFALDCWYPSGTISLVVLFAFAEYCICAAWSFKTGW